MKILKTLWTIVNSKIFLLIMLGISIAFFKNKIQNANIKEHINQQNIAALTDSIKIKISKNNDLIASINGYVSSVKNLKNINKNLYNELKKQNGKIITLNQAIIKLHQDNKSLQKYIDYQNTKFDSISKINDTTYQIPWYLTYKYDTSNFDIFKGVTNISIYNKNNIFKLNNLGTQILNRETQISLTFGEKVEDGKLRVFVSSKYPGFTATSLQGVLIDPNNNQYIKKLIKKKHWFTGFSIGIGATAGYDFYKGEPGFVIGPTIEFSIYKF